MIPHCVPNSVSLHSSIACVEQRFCLTYRACSAIKPRKPLDHEELTDERIDAMTAREIKKLLIDHGASLARIMPLPAATHSITVSFSVSVL